MIWVEALVVGALSSLIATLAWFVIFQYVLRPRIRIAPKAAWSPNEKVMFKIINASPRALIDVRFQVDLLRPAVRAKGITTVRTHVDVPADPPLMLPGRRRKSDDANAYRIAVPLDPAGIFEGSDNRYVRLRVFGRDAVSGVGAVSEQTYTHRSDIVTGSYAKGQDFEIVPDA